MTSARGHQGTLEAHPFFERSRWQRARAPVVIFLLALAVFAAFTGPRATRPSPNSHFVLLAEAFLDGRVELGETPPHENDWSSYSTLTLASGQELRGIWWDRGARKFLDLRGHLYVIDASDMRGSHEDRHFFVSFPPGPAVLMMPGVAVWGRGFNDVAFTLLFAALNVALAYVLFRRAILGGRTRLRGGDAAWLAVLLGFGTAHFWCAVQGGVWFTALIIGATFTLLYILASLDARSPFWAGVWLACAFATRTPLLFSVVFFAAFFLFPGGRLRQDWGVRFWRDGVAFAITPLIVGCLLMWANYVRYESLGEFGHRYLAGGQIDRIKDYGLFNVHWLSRNLTAALALVPKFLPEAPYVQVSKHGLAIWFTTPSVLFLAAQRRAATPADRLWRWATAATIAVIAVPHLFYQNTGWVQFGYRFAVDYFAYVVLLLALGARGSSLLFKLSVVVGVAINGFGAVTFDRAGQYYADWMLED
ncbi:MAG: hypothetical protein H6698_01005 [Myxococcales bacterium]|nr:hypothetical protein [Myxococcales bacterium]MCB9532889.1 hypothetical protein [Myxococcales bacterium]